MFNISSVHSSTNIHSWEYHCSHFLRQKCSGFSSFFYYAPRRAEALLDRATRRSFGPRLWGLLVFFSTVVFKISCYRLLQVTPGYYRLLPVTTDYYVLLRVTKSYYYKVAINIQWLLCLIIVTKGLLHHYLLLSKSTLFYPNCLTHSLT